MPDHSPDCEHGDHCFCKERVTRAWTSWPESSGGYEDLEDYEEYCCGCGKVLRSACRTVNKYSPGDATTNGFFD